MQQNPKQHPLRLTKSEEETIRRLRRDCPTGRVTIDMQDGEPSRIGNIERYVDVQQMSWEEIGKFVAEHVRFGSLTLEMRQGNPYGLAVYTAYEKVSSGF